MIVYQRPLVIFRSRPLITIHSRRHNNSLEVCWLFPWVVHILSQLWPEELPLNARTSTEPQRAENLGVPEDTTPRKSPRMKPPVDLPGHLPRKVSRSKRMECGSYLRLRDNHIYQVRLRHNDCQSQGYGEDNVPI
ncbi:uncharacterized protein LOC143232378 isoform X1 [Tachypleus tridentatus]|uniref:uncharacterized protein LOC143232378 isoform X1 n=2 Tax=Tachypleus tridentatus TaxID=6853 RepID=UPI003FD40B97